MGRILACCKLVGYFIRELPRKNIPSAENSLQVLERMDEIPSSSVILDSYISDGWFSEYTLTSEKHKQGNKKKKKKSLKK